MLGVSLGVNVQDLLAAPPGAISSDQSKFDGVQDKEWALQLKIDAQQLKTRAHNQGEQSGPPFLGSDEPGAIISPEF